VLLEAIGIHKSFGGIKALKGVCLDVGAGEVHALVGENGAGKSTLIKVLTGAIPPDEGEIRIRGWRVEHNNPAKARQLGIAAIYQQPALFPDLSVSENIAVASDEKSLWRRVDWKRRHAQAARWLEQLGARISPDAPVSSLSMAQQQLVEIAKALNTNASILIMDEPTASLGERDAENLLRIVVQLRARGTAVLYISHRIEELFRIADRVTVLRDGNTVGTCQMGGLSSNELIRMMVGRELETLYPRHQIKLGEVALDLRAISCKPLNVKNVNLTVRHGEIVGLAGLVGAGRTQLAEAVFGLAPITQGEVYVDGEGIDIRSPADAVRAGLAYVPEDRARHGVILEMPVSMNITLASLGQVSVHGLIRGAVEQELAQKVVERLQVKVAAIDTPARNLSGGNQQKISLARWLVTKPKVLILDEPTQGIDVQAKSEIYRLIGELAHSGLAILLISSDMTELLAMSDRIGVMANGTLAGVLDARHARPDQILGLALG